MTNSTTACAASPKWRALVDDTSVPAPRQKVSVQVLKNQSGIGEEFALVRDHNSPHDVVLDDEAEVDLSEGNVFYRLRRCDLQPRGRCEAPAKLALFLDDRAEVTLRRTQTGIQVLQLFGAPKHATLVRDYESPHDEVVEAEESVDFSDGPVFITRAVEAALRITINAQVFTETDGVKPEMTGNQIAALVYPEKPGQTRIWLTSDGNREVGQHEVVNIKGCESFDVVRQGVTGGFERSRVERELDGLREGGASVTLHDQPPAVVYHDVAVADGGPINETDVLVVVPGAYPGQMLDGAYLPDRSPLLGRVKGAPQQNLINALGRRWRLVSYHPHTNGVGPAWDPTRHGFHTYLGEVMSWLRDLN